MCGIAGILSSQHDLKSLQTAATLNAMQAALVHRGPDDQGQFFCSSGKAALSHTRLAIIDLSTAGHQPMCSQDGRYAMTFNGEIYNHAALREELEGQGVEFNSHGDTEVLLKLYIHEGPECVQKIRGMFAFVIWDQVQKTGFAARDPLGIKPLYFVSNSDGDFAFSSEIRSLMQAGLHSEQLSEKGLKSYFLSGTVAEPNTIVSGIQMLPAAHTLTWKAGSFSTQAYWRLNFNAPKVPIKDVVQYTRKALEDTVNAHFVSDVPVSIFLSGGIDSTALVALARASGVEKINTYSIAFESPDWNEGDMALRVADHFGTQHTEFLMTADTARPLFSEFLRAVDQPTIDGFNTFCVSKLAKGVGEKVVLSGVGADELFAGYKSFDLLPKMHRLSVNLRWFSPLFCWLSSHFGARLSHKARRALDFLNRPGSLPAAHQSLRGIFSQQEAHSLCNLMTDHNARPETQCHAAGGNELPHNSDQPKHLLDRVSEQELTTYMRNQLLRDSDVMSMANGLELRVPFVDKELLEAVTKLPANIRLNVGKKLLIEAVPELPEWVVNRPKQGFRFPFDDWFRDQWSDLPQQTQVPSWIKLTPWYRRWALVVLEDWQRRHLKQKPTRTSRDEA